MSTSVLLDAIRPLRWLSLALVLAMGFTAAPGQTPDPYQGRNEWNPIDSEIPRLPPYCQADLRPGTVQAPGTRSYDCGVWANHVCPAWVAIHRAMNPTLPMRQRKSYLDVAEGHLRYTRRHVPGTCRLLPDVEVAESQIRMLRMFVK